MPEPPALEVTGRLSALDERRRIRAGALELERLALASGTSATSVAPESGEQLIYVTRGAGAARADDGDLAVAQESILWLGPGERVTLRAGADGLDALSARVSG